MPDLTLADFLPVRTCSVARVLDQLSPRDREVFVEAMAHPQVTNARLCEKFAEYASSVNKDAVARHRKGSCPCPHA